MEAGLLSLPVLSADSRGCLLEQRVEATLALMQRLFPVSLVRHQARSIRCRDLVQGAFEQTQATFTESDAVAWADGFVFPPDELLSDERQFAQCGGSLVACAKQRWQQLLPDRLNEDRVQQWLSPNNPEFDRMLLLARDGMPVPVPPDFVPNSATVFPPLRNTYRRLASAVNKLLYQSFYSSGLAIILPRSVAIGIAGMHLSVNSWTPKQGKAQGRPIGDCSDGGPVGQPLNSRWVKDRCDTLWGAISHPTLQDLARQILDFFREANAKDPSVRWSDIRLWKMDLAGAYTLLSFAPDATPLMGFELTEDRVIFMLSGIFGWTGTPASFQVVTRAILFELDRALRGRQQMFVDDIMGVCLEWDVLFNQQTSANIITGLLGPSAVAHHKTESGRKLTEIGFDIDLDRSLVCLSDRNGARALVGFLTAAADGRATVKQMERLASWAVRYSNICCYMKPFVAVLYASYTGRVTPGLFTLSLAAMRAVRVFRMFFMLVVVSPERFCRSLSSFEAASAEVIVEYDASLSGVGVLVYLCHPSRAECPVGGVSVDISSLNFGTDSRYQNVSEFIAAVIGLCCLSAVRPGCTRLVFRGDSMTALAWNRSGRARGSIVSNALVVFNLISVRLGVTVVGTEHLSSEDNWRTDRLSRGCSMGDLARLDDRLCGLDEVAIPVQLILDACDPKRELQSDEDFLDLWIKIHKLCDTLSSVKPT